MGLLEAPQLSFGLEKAGIVRRIGSDVANVPVGDRVLSTSSQGFATVALVNEEACERLPDELSFRDGVSMPVAFTTAIYCLVDIGNLTIGQVRRLHSHSPTNHQTLTSYTGYPHSQWRWRCRARGHPGGQNDWS